MFFQRIFKDPSSKHTTLKHALLRLGAPLSSKSVKETAQWILVALLLLTEGEAAKPQGVIEHSVVCGIVYQIYRVEDGVTSFS